MENDEFLKALKAQLDAHAAKLDAHAAKLDAHDQKMDERLDDFTDAIDAQQEATDDSDDGATLPSAGDVQATPQPPDGVVGEGEALARMRTQLDRLAKLTGRADPMEQEGIVLGWKKGADVARAQGEELARLRAQGELREITDVVDGAIREGKAIPAQREALLEMGRTGGCARLRAFVEATPRIAPYTSAAVPANVGSDGLIDAALAATIRVAGADPKVVAKHLKAPVS